MVGLSRRCQKLLEKARANPGGLRFREARRLAECLGLALRRVSGSHYVFQGRGRFANLQPGSDGMAKDYQIRQLLRIADSLVG